MSWKKTSKRESAKGTVIEYQREGLKGVVVESRKIQQPHASKSGWWWYTSYWVMAEGYEKEYHSLKDAKEAAEQFRRESNG